MNLRYSRPWTKTVLGQAVVSTIGWQHAVPRVGGLFPGITQPIPNGSPVSLIEAVEDSTKSLLAAYQTLYVMWSGGVDSTLVAAALATFKKPEHTIIISRSDQSMTDSPSEVYEKLINLGCVGEDYNIDRMKEVTGQGGMVVTGYHADSIMVGEMADGRGLHDVIHQMTPLELIMTHTELSQARSAVLIKQLEPILSLMPVERTAANVAWWLDFTCCWSRDEYDLHYRLGLDEPGKGYVSFFNTEYFQRWSIQDAKLKSGTTNETKKYQYVEIVEKYLGSVGEFKKNLISVDLYNIDNILENPKLMFIKDDYSYHIER